MTHASQWIIAASAVLYALALSVIGIREALNEYRDVGDFAADGMRWALAQGLLTAALIGAAEAIAWALS
jgi:hypothetical protein